MVDANFNLLLAWKSLIRLGYQRIGACLAEDFDRNSYHMIRSTLHYLHATTPLRHQVRPLIHSHNITGAELRSEVLEWVRSERPQVVIGHDNRLVEWLESDGYRIPDDCGVAHLAIDDDVIEWAGVYSNRKLVGSAAVERVTSLIYNRQFGVPAFPLTSTIRGKWHSGSTLPPQAP